MLIPQFFFLRPSNSKGCFTSFAKVYGVIGEVPAFYFHFSPAADFSKFDRKMVKGNRSVARVVWTAGDT